MLPHVAVCQWVLSLPHPLRDTLAYDQRSRTAVHRVLARVLRTRLRWLARRAGCADADTGSVTFVQRFPQTLRTWGDPSRAWLKRLHQRARAARAGCARARVARYILLVPPKSVLPSRVRPSLRVWLVRAVIVAAYGYPALLLALALAMRSIGEDWWATTAALYLPRIAFLLPIPFLTLLLLTLRLRRSLPTQLLALLIGVFPLMGFELPSFEPERVGLALKLLSLNVDSEDVGPERLVADLVALEPDVLLLQETRRPEHLVRGLRAHFASVQTDGQFLIATRFPVLATTLPEPVIAPDRPHSPRFVAYELDTPLGKLAVYNVHPLSPREGLIVLRGRGIPRELLSGRLLRGKNVWALERDTVVRKLQVEAFARAARAHDEPVIIAGDTNLPGSSAVARRELSDFQDGFESAGVGFGYTFPAGREWMRLDRIFASSELQFLSFEVGCGGISDHRCVLATLQRVR